MNGYKLAKKVAVPASGSTVIALPSGRGTLEKLTIWAVGGDVTLQGLTFQPRVNGVAWGPSVAHAGPSQLVRVIYQDAVGTVTENALIPSVKTPEAQRGSGPPVIPFAFDVLISSTHGAVQELTIVATAIEYAV